MTDIPLLSLVVAMARNHVIGHENTLPWRLSEDLKRFKAVTMGKPILMGRRTYDSIGKPLPGRANLVLTRDPNWNAAGAAVVVVSSLDEAIKRSHRASELAVIGGADVFRMALPRARVLYLTWVEAEVEGDTRFPEFDMSEWDETVLGTHPADDRNQYPMTFLRLDRC
jgi:dihydrofolate reductase